MPVVQYRITIEDGLLNGLSIYKYSKREADSLVSFIELKFKVSVIEEAISSLKQPK